MISHFSHVQLFASPWTVTPQAPCQDSPGKNNGVDLPDSGIEHASLMSPELADRFFITSTTWKAHNNSILKFKDSLGTQQIP